MGQSLEERIKLFEKEQGELLKKYNLKIEIILAFPVYNVLPEEIRLSLLILERHKGIYKMNFSDFTKEDNANL